MADMLEEAMTQVEKMPDSTEKTETLEALQEGTKLVTDR